LREENIALVTGASSGIGLETSLLLARNGFYTYATTRKSESDSNPVTNAAKKENISLKTIQLDVDNDISVRNCVDTILSEKGRIDVAVNNAGYALGGALEETSIEEARKQFETNFFGAVRVMQATIPIMRKQRRGRIVNITSMGGRIAIPLDPFYHGSKFALEGLSESIQYELEPLGIKIILIEPGAVRTNFWSNIKFANRAHSPSSQYSQLESKMSTAFEKMEENAIHPSEVAKVILKAVTSDDPQLRYTVGTDAARIMESRKSMSDKEFGNLIKQTFMITEKVNK
jgi:NAD(P)-dependent dehydrogenase (short-subunit alcohol dehydrogenase family)